MRRLIGPALVGLGVFLIVAAALARFYAYPALAKVPASYESTTTLEAEGAQVLNFSTYESETHDLSIESYTVEDSTADTPDGVVVWQNSVTVERGDGSTFQQTRERAPFDEVTGAAADCDGCPSYYEVKEGDEIEQSDVTRDGQIYKFPFDTQQQDYPVWDGTIGEAVPATYEGEDEIQGLRVYKFVQQIEPTVVDVREVPNEMFGTEEAVNAEMVYAMTRTFYIEPTTGSPIQRVEQRTQELQYDGQAVPVFNATVQYTDGQVDDMVDDIGTKATLLGGMRLLFPVLLVVLGLAALAGGLVLERRAGRRDPAVAETDRPLAKV